MVAENDFGSHPYTYGKRRPELISKEGQYPADTLTARAVNYLKLAHRRPFFLMLSHYYVHTPVDTPCMWLVGKYQKKIPPTVRNRAQRIKYAAFVETLDHYVGEVLRALDAAKKRDRTLVVFTSDNGGHPEYTGNGPLRGSKWNLYEGGIRVPLLVRWPGRVRAGEVCGTPVCGYDLFATFADAARAPVDPEQAELDGRSLVPLFSNPGEKFDRALYWHFPYYHPEGEKFGKAHGTIGMNDFRVSQTRPASALRRGKNKVLYFHEDERVELYDLEFDRGEAEEFSAGEPRTAKALKEELQGILRDVKARMPRGMISRE